MLSVEERYERSLNARVVVDIQNRGTFSKSTARAAHGAAVRVVLRPLEYSRQLAARPLSDADVRSFAIEALQEAQAALR